MRQDEKDLRDVLMIVDIYRCPMCKRMGLRAGMLCFFCRYDPSTVKLPPVDKKLMTYTGKGIPKSEIERIKRERGD